MAAATFDGTGGAGGAAGLRGVQCYCAAAAVPGAGQRGGTPDLSLFYSQADLYRWAEAYGEQGRQEYVQARFTFDVAWPLVYTFFLVTAISWLCAKAFEPASRWQLANLAPVLGMSFDFLENIATSLVMMRYPLPTPLLDALAGVFTLFKWGFIGASFVLLLVASGGGGVEEVVSKSVCAETRFLPENGFLECGYRDPSVAKNAPSG